MIREHRDKPRTMVIRLLNDIADRGAILDLLGVPAAEADRDLVRYADRRIAPARHHDDGRREGRWVDGRWLTGPSPYDED